MADNIPGATNLTDQPSDELKVVILQRLWQWREDQIDLEEYDTFFDHYWETCHNLDLGARSKADTLAVRTHEGLLQIVDLFWAHQPADPTTTRVRLRESLKGQLFKGESDQRINDSIELALSLWLTLNIGKGNPNAPHAGLAWDDERPLAKLISTRFAGAKADGRRTNPLLGLDMTAVKLEKWSGITIKWTHCLDDHLSLSYIKDQRTLKVYDLDQILHCHRTR